MNRKLLAMAVATLVSGPVLAAGTGTGWSGQSSPTAAPDFTQLDTNQDGVVSESEAAASQHVQRHFAKVDANGNRELDRAEFSAFEFGVIGWTSNAPGGGEPKH